MPTWVVVCGVLLRAFTMSSVVSNDLLTKLGSLEQTKPISKDGQNIVLPLIEVFKIFLGEISKKFDDFKTEMLEASVMKDQEISRMQDLVNTKNHEVADLKQQLSDVNNEIDALNQYERKDQIVLSGPAVYQSNETDCKKLVQSLLRENFELELDGSEISTTHFLGPLRRNNSNGPIKKNITVKLVRRDVKKMIIQASKVRRSNKKLFANESLTPLRRSIFHTLQAMKSQEPTLVKGYTSVEGQVFAFTPSVGTSPHDQRHLIITMDQLKEFCRTYVKRPLDSFLQNQRS